MKCPKCKITMVKGIALAQTYVGSEDFGGDYGQAGTTISPGGPGKMIDVMKCPQCGHSIKVDLQ